MKAIEIIVNLHEIHTTYGIEKKRKAIKAFRDNLGDSDLEKRVNAFMEVQQNCIVTNESEWSNGIAYYCEGLRDALGFTTAELIKAMREC